MTYTQQDLDKMFREAIELLRPLHGKEWPSGCGWSLEIDKDGRAFMVVTFDVETRHWPKPLPIDRPATKHDGGCTDYCRYESRKVLLPL